jgi:aspartate aminotransferase
MSLLSTRLNRIKPSITISITNKAIALKNQGYDIISLGIGEPDFDTPDNIKAYAIKAINKGLTKYTNVDGTIELKKAICAKFKRENNLEYTTDQVTVGAGAKQVLYNALMASLNPGDEVIIPAPYWVSYPDMVNLAEGTPVIVNCSLRNNFRLDPTDLEKAITPKTKWLILNSPSNPTGSTYTRNDLKQLAEVLLKHPHVYIISDDIYEHVLYDGFEFVTLAEVEPRLYDRVLTLNGVSKSYAMTGWRIGYAAGPKELIKAIGTIQSQSTSNPCSISQAAAVEALNGPQDFIKTNTENFKKKRDTVINLLNQIDGFECNKPEGAFYVFPACSKLFGKKTTEGKIIENSNDLSEYLLTESLVSTVCGSAFGMEGFIRISYALSIETLTEACNRIKKAVEKLL